MTKKLYTDIVTVACLLFFTQCSSQASLSDDIEALKKQLQEVKDNPPGSGGQGSLSGLEQQIQQVNTGLAQQIQRTNAATKNDLEQQIQQVNTDLEQQFQRTNAATKNDLEQQIQQVNTDLEQQGLFKKAISVISDAIDASRNISEILKDTLKEPLDSCKQYALTCKLNDPNEDLIIAINSLKRLKDLTSSQTSSPTIPIPTEVFYINGGSSTNSGPHTAEGITDISDPLACGSNSLNKKIEVRRAPSK
jgi:DNA repair exonuclease SbcCD ATPase subunit